MYDTLFQIRDFLDTLPEGTIVVTDAEVYKLVGLNRIPLSEHLWRLTKNGKPWTVM